MVVCAKEILTRRIDFFVNVVTALLDPSAKKKRLAVKIQDIIHIIVDPAEEFVSRTCAYVSADTLVIFVRYKSHQVCHGIVETASLVALRNEGKREPRNQIALLKILVSDLLVNCLLFPGGHQSFSPTKHAMYCYTLSSLSLF